jgi:TonB-dependent receptor
VNSGGPGYTGDAIIKRTFGPGDNFGFVGAVSLHHDHSEELENNVTAYTQTNGISEPSSLLQHGAYDNNDSGYSLLGKLEARAANKFYTFIEASYFDEQMDITAYRGNLAVLTPNITVDGDGTGTFTKGSAEAFSYKDALSRKVFNTTGGAEYKINSISKISLTAAVEVSDHDEEIHSGSNFIYAGLAGAYDINNFDPVFSLNANSGLSNAANWFITPSSASTITHLPQQDNIYNAKLDYNLNNFPGSRGFGFASGVNFREFLRNFNQSSDNYTLPKGTVFDLAQVLQPSPTSNLTASGPIYINYSEFWNYITSSGIDAPTQALSSSYRLLEDVYAAYATVYFSTSRLRLLGGVRYEATYFTDRTAQILNSVMTPYAYSRNYNSLLPNVQGVYDVTDHLRFNAAFTETLARPGFSTFGPGQTINNFTNQNTINISGTNPNVRAALSKNYDVGLESFYTGGYVSVALFYKSIEHQIYTLTTTTPNAAGGVTTLSIPENAGHSDVLGVELSVDWHDFGQLWSPLQGVGVRANYTPMRGRLEVLTTSGASRTIDGLNQQPDYELNLIGYYDRGPFSGSINFSARGLAFNSTVGTTPAGDFYIAPNSNLNARLAYRATHNIQFFLEMRNLLNDHYEEVTGQNKNLLTTSIVDGQTFLVGAQLKY